MSSKYTWLTLFALVLAVAAFVVRLVLWLRFGRGGVLDLVFPAIMAVILTYFWLDQRRRFPD